MVGSILFCNTLVLTLVAITVRRGRVAEGQSQNRINKSRDAKQLPLTQQI